MICLRHLPQSGPGLFAGDHDGFQFLVCCLGRYRVTEKQAENGCEMLAHTAPVVMFGTRYD
jgi:hypothetical protein